MSISKFMSNNCLLYSKTFVSTGVFIMRTKMIWMVPWSLVLIGCQPAQLEIRSTSASERELMRGARELVQAIEDGDVERAKKLAHLYWVPVLPEANKIPMGDKCFFPIHAAAGAGDLEVLRALIAKGADVNARDNSGWTPIMWAVTRSVFVKQKRSLQELNESHVKCIRELVKAGADINAGTRYGWTALHWVSLGNPDTMPHVRVLIELGADVNRINKDGETPLHVWCRTTTKADKKSQQFREAVRYLLEHGADVCIKDNEGHYAEDWLDEKVPEQKLVLEMIRERRQEQEKAKKKVPLDFEAKKK
jgi:hypothetical protein